MPVDSRNVEHFLFLWGTPALQSHALSRCWDTSPWSRPPSLHYPQDCRGRGVWEANRFRFPSGGRGAWEGPPETRAPNGHSVNLHLVIVDCKGACRGTRGGTVPVVCPVLRVLLLFLLFQKFQTRSLAVGG